jgi:hypothetical protein
MAWRLALSVLLVACAGNDDTTTRDPITPAADAGVEAMTAWSDAEKCENMCQRYCVKRYMCDGSEIDACRMAIDEADGGTCEERAPLFEDIAESRVRACIDAVEAMTCTAFLHMYDTGEGVPSPCHGILI